MNHLEQVWGGREASSSRDAWLWAGVVWCQAARLVWQVLGSQQVAAVPHGPG